MLAKTAGEIGVTPKYDNTDLLVTFDLREWAEFFLTRVPGAWGSTVSTSWSAFSVFMENLF